MKAPLLLHLNRRQLFADNELEVIIADGDAIDQRGMIGRDGFSDSRQDALLQCGPAFAFAIRLADLIERLNFSFA